MSNKKDKKIYLHFKAQKTFSFIKVNLTVQRTLLFNGPYSSTDLTVQRTLLFNGNMVRRNCKNSSDTYLT